MHRTLVDSSKTVHKKFDQWTHTISETQQSRDRTVLKVITAGVRELKQTLVSSQDGDTEVYSLDQKRAA